MPGFHARRYRELEASLSADIDLGIRTAGWLANYKSSERAVSLEVKLLVVWIILFTWSVGKGRDA